MGYSEATQGCSEKREALKNRWGTRADYVLMENVWTPDFSLTVGRQGIILLNS